MCVFVLIRNPRWPSQDKFNIVSNGKSISRLISDMTEPFVSKFG
jgi:hypothetical protein